MIKERPRRLRRSAAIRNMVRESQWSSHNLVAPLFLVEDLKAELPIKTLPGISRMGIDAALRTIESGLELGIAGYALFPVVPEERKDRCGSESKRPEGLMPSAIRAIKERFPEACLFSDVALDPYSSDGHDGLVDAGHILNDETLPLLAEMALVQAQAGADFVAPSDMMDGRVGYLRDYLDRNGCTNTGILSYCAKYASAFYGPFRDALDSAPKSGDKKTYQMNPANRREARREARLDQAEGADILMVKPALAYLDVIQDLKAASDLPVAAYNVSGEYAMVKAAAQLGCLDEARAIDEILTGIHRAGADLIFTYHAFAAAEVARHRTTATESR